jgi:hypothetical protein
MNIVHTIFTRHVPCALRSLTGCVSHLEASENLVIGSAL